MIGNNSCGTHGLYAGKTSDNVDRLRVVLAGGEELEVGAYPTGARKRPRPGEAGSPAYWPGCPTSRPGTGSWPPSGSRTSPAG